MCECDPNKSEFNLSDEKNHIIYELGDYHFNFVPVLIVLLVLYELDEGDGKPADLLVQLACN